MTRGIPGPGIDAFALPEALIALLLLAVALLGCMRSVADTLATQHAALLQSRAADLAADLVEALRAEPDSASRHDLILAWQRRVREVLPANDLTLGIDSLAAVAPDSLAGDFAVQMKWRNPRLSTTLAVNLPIALASGEWRP